MLSRRTLLAALPATALPGPGRGQAVARPKVVATFSIVGDLAREVGGPDIDLSVLVGPDADAHTYQPRPADARTLAAAQVLVSNGLGYEGWIDRLAAAAPFRGRSIVASTGVETLKAAPTSGAGHGHDHGPARGVDPHCWQDVGRARRYAATITEGLAAAAPANAAAIRARGADYDRRLAALDAWVRGEIDRVPPARRRALVGHDSLRYFAAAYGVTFVSPRGFSTDSEPSARDVAALIRLVREQKLKALFLENMSSPGLVEQIARESGAVVGPRLYSDALSKPDGPAPTYEAMMRHNVGALVAGMSAN